MPAIRYPAPLAPGDVVGVTSPSSGVEARLRPRLDVALRRVRRAGYEVRLGDCMDGARHVSAPARERAAEFQAMLLDPAVRAIVPPWGGETAIDLIDLLDWEAVAAAEPTWVVGFSDIATLLTPLTLLTGVATIHGNNLMDTPYAAPDGLLDWLDVVAAPRGATLTHRPPGRWREGFVDYAAHPEADRYDLDRPGGWVRLDTAGGEGPGAPLDVSGRLIGGCIETLANLAGTRFLDTSGLRAAAGREGLLVYVEAAGDDAPTICRNLHGMRLAGFFEGARAVLIGRTAAPDHATLTQHEAAYDALHRLGVPLLADVECGHVAPYLALVNGARTRVLHGGGRTQVTQTLS